MTPQSSGNASVILERASHPVGKSVNGSPRLSLACLFVLLTASALAAEPPDFVQQTRTFIEGIKSAKRMDDDGRSDVAAGYLLRLAPLLLSLQEESKGALRRKEIERDSLYAASQKAEKAIGVALTAERTANSNANALRPERAKKLESYHQNRAQMTKYLEDIKTTDATCEELLSWINSHKDQAFIPFYGIAIAVQVDEKNSKRNQLISTRNAWAKDYNKLIGESAANYSQYVDLDQRIGNFERAARSAQHLRVSEEAEKRNYDRLWTRAQDAFSMARLAIGVYESIQLDDSPSLLANKLESAALVGKPEKVSELLLRLALESASLH